MEDLSEARSIMIEKGGKKSYFWVFGGLSTYFELYSDGQGHLLFSGWTCYFFFDERVQKEGFNLEFFEEINNFPFLNTAYPFQLLV